VILAWCVHHTSISKFCRKEMTLTRLRFLLLLLLVTLIAAGCGAAVQPIVPTARPTLTPSPTARPTDTPDRDAPPTATATLPPDTPSFGPSPTPLFGSPLVAQANPQTQPTSANPNAPRIEFFTTDVAAVAPGDGVNLYWSTRNAVGANIYRVVNGVRNQVWNVGPDGSLTVPTNRRDRGGLEFLLVVGDGAQTAEQTLMIPLACPDVWFFQPAPEACPLNAAQETLVIEQSFQTGRMVFIQSTNTVYALFNDGRAPAWISLPNRYDPAIHPEFDPEFANALPPGFFQPLRVLGFVWRGNDTVRNRLGLGVESEFSFNGFVQSAGTDDNETLFVSSADGSVLQFLPRGEVWQIITPP